LAVYHVLPIAAFHDGVCSFEKAVEAKRRWPNRILTYCGVDPLAGRAALDVADDGAPSRVSRRADLSGFERRAAFTPENFSYAPRGSSFRRGNLLQGQNSPHRFDLREPGEVEQPLDADPSLQRTHCWRSGVSCELVSENAKIPLLAGKIQGILFV
jgi:hypothetical protein